MTQQLVKNLVGDRRKVIGRKVTEGLVALWLESHLSKKGIFEAYVNAVDLGSNTRGVEAAARRNFSKSLQNLNEHQMLTLAAMFKAPSHYHPFKHRKKLEIRNAHILNQMVEENLISHETSLQIMQQPLALREYWPKASPANEYYRAQVKAEFRQRWGRKLDGRNVTVHSFLDSDVQSIVQRVTQEVSQSRPDLEMAAVVIDNNSGGVIALQGGADFEHSQFNRATQAFRPGGSILKPFVYGLALLYGYKFNDVIWIKPKAIGGYLPKWAGKSWENREVTLLKALWKSFNGPVVWLGNRLGVDKVSAFLKKLGLQATRADEDLDLSFLLGAGGIRLIDVVNAYSTIARGGIACEARTIKTIISPEGKKIAASGKGKFAAGACQKVLDAKYSAILAKALEQVMLRGTARKAASIHAEAVGKTGTSDDNRDNWFVGFSNTVTVGVWVGRDDFGEIPGGGADRLALPYWHKIMDALNQLNSFGKLRLIHQPGIGVRKLKIDENHGNISGRGTEVFLDAAQQPQPRNVN